MGNSKSQPCKRGRPPYLLYLIHRTWSAVVNNRDTDSKGNRYEDTDRETDLSSRCSGCKGCGYQQDSLTLDSESDMAPNAEEELLVVKPWGPQPEKERLRPPTYNAEDYALALRRWGKRPMSSVQDSQGTLPSTTSSSSGYVSGSGEMTLRQFTSVSELLNKLRADLRLAFPSFVQEFASPPADGITLLLETLRGVQLAQSTPPSSGHTGPRIGTRRAALDELGCVECLAACSERCTDAPRLLIQAHPGLLALAVCLTSSLNRSRVLALQLLTKVCQTPGGHSAVSEAVSTLRLRYGEGGRFRFLAGALLAPRAAIALRVAGVSFLNAFLKSASRTQTKLYIQAEACEAGLEPKVLQGWLTEIDSHEEDALTDLLHKEVQKWTNNCVDVESLQRRVHRAEETCRVLSKRVSVLQNQLQKMQLEKINDYNLQDNASKDTQKVSSNAEDEGISSSERSSSPEELKRQSRTTQNIKIHDNDQETTIDDVIEELRIIVKDAEEEFVDKSKKNENGNVSEEKIKEASIGSNSTRRLSSNSRSMSKSALEETRNGFYPNREGSLKIVVKGPEMEEAIIPAILHPQPPRRTPPCLSTILVTRHCDFVDTDQVYNSHDEEETLGDGSDSLLSASRLRYNRSYEPGEEQPPKKDDKNVRNEDAEKSGKLDKSNYSGNYYDLEANAKRKVSSSDQTSITFNKQFEASKNSGGSRHSSKYRSEVEKRKLLRRTTSHDLVNSSTTSSPRSRRSGGSKIEGHIRKFESLNSFDDQRSLQNYSRYSDTRRSSVEDVTKVRMKRSESFHHVSQLTRNDKGSSKGGSDSGLFYVTNFDLEPFVTNRNSEISQSPNLTKSLDRIDEGLDSMVDIIITEEKQQWMKTQSKNQQNKVELRKQEKLRKTSSFHEKQLKSDELYVNSHLRSDELYDDTDRIQQWNYFNEFNKSKKHQSNNFAEVHKARNDSGKNRGFSNRGNESGIFLPTSKPYDVFGLGKNRFNAGKYSGDRIVKENNGNKAIGGRTSSSSQIANRGKVTDVLSGLY